MKALRIKIKIAFIICCFSPGLKAQGLSALKPDHAVLQYAGSIGYVSVGLGYDLFKKKRGSLEFNYGYVPEDKGGTLHIASTKFAYRPWQIKIKEFATVYPVNPGVFFSYHFGKQFDIAFDREQYGKSYYGWSTAIRGHISLSNEIKLYTGEKKSVTLYSEFNTSDLYLASMFFKNNRKWLSPQDIVKLGIGLKVGF
ncbi:MAG: hypothetical protein H7Y13_08365 [Sphingobacteriaceae bacterium]|nr:hypothetical protein [Sphingobacteriaceae bacterium]